MLLLLLESIASDSRQGLSINDLSIAPVAGEYVGYLYSWRIYSSKGGGMDIGFSLQFSLRQLKL